MDVQRSSGENAGLPNNVVMAARTGKAILLCVLGLGDMKNAIGMWDFTEEMVERGYRYFCLDLAGCRGMDSTFMGSLVGLSSRLKELGSGRVSVVNASRSNRDLLEIVGADRFLEIKGELDVEGIEMEILPGGDSPLSKRLEMVRRAHENLVHIDKRNEGRFSAFLRALSSELSS